MRIEHIQTSPRHNYVGHHGKPPGDAPCIAHERVELLAGQGIVGDRFADREPGHPKQITFFSMDVLDALAENFGMEVAPAAVRRNVFVRGVDLPAWVGRTFQLQGIRFYGVDACKPCYWMDQAIAPGAEEFLKGKGGLRAKILDDGRLTLGEASWNEVAE